MKLAGLWRLLAIGVALMAWLDPPVGVRTVPPVPVDVVVTEGREPAARALLAEVAPTRPAHVVFAPTQAIAADRPMPCAPTRACLVLGQAHDPVRLPADALPRVALVTLPPDTEREARVIQVRAPGTHQQGAALAFVTIESRGLTGERGRVVLTIANQPVGAADITFAADGRAEIAVTWVPPSVSPAVLQASVEVLAGEPNGTGAARPPDAGAPGVTAQLHGSSRSGDPSVSVLVPIRLSPWPVLVHEARPSWATTFVRRALEADPRFAVSAETDLAPGVTLGRGLGRTSAAPLTDGALNDTYVALVGAAEQLSAGEVARLERFVRERGGALVLVPDREWSGPVTRLLPGRWQLATSDEPRRIGPLTGREWLLADQLGSGDTRVLSEGDVIGATVTPMGHGLLLVSGAVDAWRFRGDGTDWNRFWVRLLADVASRTPGRLEVSLRPGDRAGRFLLDIRRRSLLAQPALEIAARQQCAEETPRPLRVWPGLHLDQFRVEVTSAAALCDVVVTAGDDTASVTLPAADMAPGLGAQTLTEWSPAVARAGGTSVTGEAANLTEVLEGMVPPDATDDVRYPMRSPLWMVVFLGSLGIEWWLRRRSGGR
jgi:hypothetical protein